MLKVENASNNMEQSQINTNDISKINNNNGASLEFVSEESEIFQGDISKNWSDERRDFEIRKLRKKLGYTDKPEAMK